MRRAAVLVALCLLCAPGVARAGTLVALALDRDTREPLVGATVVVTGPALAGSQAAITDEHGEATIPDLFAGTYDVTFYYTDTTVRRTGVAVAAAATPASYVTVLIQPHEIVCWFPGYGPPIIDLRAGLLWTLDTDLRRRVPEAIGERRPGDVRVAGFRLPAGLGPVPEALTADVGVVRAGYSQRLGGTAGPITLIDPITGTNELHGRVDARAGTPGYQLSGSLAGPITRDRAWFAIGGAPWRRGDSEGASAFARVNLAITPEHQGETLALVTRARDRDDDVRLAGGGARWTSRWHDNRTELDLAAGRFVAQHRPTAGSDWRDDLAQASATVSRRQRAAGHHELVAGIDLARQVRTHPDRKRAFTVDELGVHAGDAWTPRPNLGLELGARVDRERAVDARGVAERTAVSPRVGLWYDWTREGRARAFAHWGRYRAAAGAGRADPVSLDVGLAGIEYELLEDLAVALAYERRDAADGAVATVRARLPRLDLATAVRAGQRDPVTGRRFSVESRAATELDLCFADDLWLGLIVRAGVDGTSGVSVGKTWRAGDDRLRLGVELTGQGALVTAGFER